MYSYTKDHNENEKTAKGIKKHAIKKKPNIRITKIPYLIMNKYIIK